LREDATIHVSQDFFERQSNKLEADKPYYGPHVTGKLHGKTVHVPHVGQTTLSMFEKGSAGHNLEQFEVHRTDFPIFADSGWGSPRDRFGSMPAPPPPPPPLPPFCSGH